MRSSVADAEVYRDERLDDEAELRELVGEDATAMRLLRGWVDGVSARARLAAEA